MQSDHRLTVKEVAQVMDITISTVHRYINQKLLTPIDNTAKEKKFDKNKVEDLKKTLRKPGLSPSEAARLLDVTSMTIHNYIKKGQLEAKKQMYKGSKRYFIQEKEINRLLNERKKSGKDFYDDKQHYYLYQSFNHETNALKARVISLEDEGMIKTETNKLYSISEAQEKGYKPVNIPYEQDWITKMGYVVFSFTKPTIVLHLVYDLIELFYRLIGNRNIRLFHEDNNIYMELKPFKATDEPLLETESNISFLKDHLIEGRIQLQPDGVLFDSELEAITIYPTESIKKDLIIEAKKNHKSLNQYVMDIIMEKLEKQKTEK